MQTVALTVGLIALACLVGLLLSWKMPDSPARRLRFLPGIAMLPRLSLFLGANAAIEEAKKPGFCASCHVMQPFTNNFVDPDSTTLAAVHYQNRYILNNQCYTCHSDHTIFGPRGLFRPKAPELEFSGTWAPKHKLFRIQGMV